MAATTAAKAMLKRLGLTDGAADEITSATGQNLSQVEDFAVGLECNDMTTTTITYNINYYYYVSHDILSEYVRACQPQHDSWSKFVHNSDHNDDSNRVCPPWWKRFGWDAVHI